MVDLHYVEDYRQVLEEPFRKGPVSLEFSLVNKKRTGCRLQLGSCLNNLPGVGGKVHCGGTLGELNTH